MAAATPAWLNGSSPHTRRTPIFYRKGALDMRFISAHAENTINEAAAALHEAVHLRTRGEHAKIGVRPSSHSGSSPHTRRTLSSTGRRCRTIRFISAHAENTLPSLAQIFGDTVHLRTRGEHLTVGDSKRAECGSSPHTRRTLKGCGLDFMSCRFISAHAENTADTRN